MILKTEVYYSYSKGWRIRTDTRTIRDHILQGYLYLDNDFEVLTSSVVGYDQVSYVVRYFCYNYDTQLLDNNGHLAYDNVPLITDISTLDSSMPVIKAYLFLPLDVNTNMIRGLPAKISDKPNLVKKLHHLILNKLKSISG